jgi:hypothetical protein
LSIGVFSLAVLVRPAQPARFKKLQAFHRALTRAGSAVTTELLARVIRGARPSHGEKWPYEISSAGQAGWLDL